MKSQAHSDPDVTCGPGLTLALILFLPLIVGLLVCDSTQDSSMKCLSLNVSQRQTYPEHSKEFHSINTSNSFHHISNRKLVTMMNSKNCIKKSKTKFQSKTDCQLIYSKTCYAPVHSNVILMSADTAKGIKKIEMKKILWRYFKI